MEITDLSRETETDYFTCLDDWSEEMKDGICRKQCWYNEMSRKGLRVKLARNDEGSLAGMIQYAPVEHSWAEGHDLYFVYCIWVHAHKKGRGDQRRRGAGKALIQAAEEDVKGLGAKGLAVWGLSVPVFIPAGWYKKQGYRKIDSLGGRILLWKPFLDDAEPPRWIRGRKKPETATGRVTVTALSHGWCGGVDSMMERAAGICREMGDRVVFKEIDTRERATIREWGLTDALFIDQKNIYKGPPLSYDKIRKAVEKRLKRL